uniref:hypothetical protein n=1 Tax=Streptomyces sp. NBC_01001 TaxID=2903713 RepID=UPI002F913B59
MGSWLEDQPFPGHLTLGSPALAVFRDALHLAYADAVQRITVTASRGGRARLRADQLNLKGACGLLALRRSSRSV